MILSYIYFYISSNYYYCSGKWKNTIEQQNLFLEYAKQNHFDALNPENWYLHKNKVLRYKVHIFCS